MDKLGKLEGWGVAHPLLVRSYGMLTYPHEVRPLGRDADVQGVGAVEIADTVEVDLVPADLSRPRDEIVHHLTGVVMDVNVGTLQVIENTVAPELNDLRICLDTLCWLKTHSPEAHQVIAQSAVTANRPAMLRILGPILAEIPEGSFLDGKRPGVSYPLGGRYGRVVIGGNALFDITSES